MSVLRDLSIILLAGEVFVLALLPLAALAAAVYGLWWLQRRDHAPAWLAVGRAYGELSLAYVRLAMGIAVRPILALHSALATVNRWLRSAILPSTGEEETIP